MNMFHMLMSRGTVLRPTLELLAMANIMRPMATVHTAHMKGDMHMASTNLRHITKTWVQSLMCLAMSRPLWKT